jgi:hypothetical protein
VWRWSHLTRLLASPHLITGACGRLSALTRVAVLAVSLEEARRAEIAVPEKSVYSGDSDGGRSGSLLPKLTLGFCLGPTRTVLVLCVVLRRVPKAPLGVDRGGGDVRRAAGRVACHSGPRGRHLRPRVG